MNTISGGKRRAKPATRLFARPTRYLIAVVLAVVQACAATAPAPAKAAAWAFVAPGDPRSDSSIRTNAVQLDAIVSGWIQLDSLTGTPTLLYPDDAPRIPPSTRRLALITSWQGHRFHPEEIRRLAASEPALTQVAARIGQIVARGRYAGVVFDFEDQSRQDIPLVLRMIRAVRDSIRQRGPATITVALPATDTTAYPSRAFAADADNVMVMLDDEHWPTSPPGPIASPLWVRRALAQRVSDVGAARVIAVLPLFSYLWRASEPAQTLSYDEALHAATEANVDLQRDPTSRALHAIERGGWELWMTDAEQLRALRDEVLGLGVMTVAYWRLGLEQAGTLSNVRP